MVQFLPLFGRQSAPCLEYYTIIYMLVVVSQMMLDAAYFQAIIAESTESDTPTISLYKCIIIPLHCLQATLQFFFGFDLHKATIKKSYRRARNWQMIFFCLLAVEVAVFCAYIALASFFSIFTYVTAAAIVFKTFLIWPLRIFLEECHEVCVPLAQSAENHHHRRDNVVPSTSKAIPVPSCSSAPNFGRGQRF